jgi:hypothetical protein
MSYQLTTAKTILRLTDNAFIPPDPANQDYAEYLDWLEEGNEPLPADPLPELKEPTIQEKLESAGITLDELKKALGL